MVGGKMVVGMADPDDWCCRFLVFQVFCKGW